MLTLHLNEAGLLKYNETISSKLIITIDDLDNECDLDNEENESETVIKAEKFEQKLEPIEMKPLSKVQRLASNSSMISTPTKPSLQSLVSRKTSSNKQFKLNEVTSGKLVEFSSKNYDDLLFKTYTRILSSEETVTRSKEAQLIRKKIIVETTTLPNYDNHLTNYIFEDVRKRIDLGLMWIFNNYMNLKSAQNKRNNLERIDKDEDLDEQTEEDLFKATKKYELDYDRTLYTILFNLQQRQDPRDL
jgi:hypothetical protein